MVYSRDRVIELVNLRVSHFPHIELCMLYGSANQDRLTRQSDIDLAVASADGLTPEQCMDFMLEIGRELDREVSVIDMDKMNGIILQEVLVNGYTILSNNPVILKKIESLKFCVGRIQAKRPPDSETLKNDLDIQDIISVNLERAVQLCVDICALVIAERDLRTSNTMAGTFRILESAGSLSPDLSLKMQKAVGFRDISVHEYEDLDWDLVFDIISNHLTNFSCFVREIDRIAD